jgi:uncharacterized DUF497 family protein
MVENLKVLRVGSEMLRAISVREVVSRGRRKYQFGY